MAMKSIPMLSVAGCLCVPMLSANAASVTIQDDNFDFVNRLAGGDGNVNDADWWSVFANAGSINGAQQTYASIQSSLPSALDADSGGLGTGQSYVINSASLTFMNNQFGAGTAYLATTSVDFTAARTTTTSDGSTLWPDGNEPGTSASWTGNANSAPSAYLTTVGSFTVDGSGNQTGTVDLTAFASDLLAGNNNGRLFMSSSPAGNGTSTVNTVQNVNWGGAGAHWAKAGNNVYLDVDYSVLTTGPLVLSVDTVNSDNNGNSAFGGSVGGTLNDTFAYDVDNPTSPLPDQSYSQTNDGFHANLGTAVTANLAYTVDNGDVTLAGFQTLVIDLYGRDSFGDRDNDFDINLFDDGLLVATAANLAIPDDSSQHLRVDNADFDVSLTGLTFDAIRIAARDSNGSGDNNYFTLMEIRASIVPEPSSLALLGLGGLCVLRRRRA